MLNQLGCESARLPEDKRGRGSAGTALRRGTKEQQGPGRYVETPPVLGCGKLRLHRTWDLHTPQLRPVATRTQGSALAPSQGPSPPRRGARWPQPGPSTLGRRSPGASPSRMLTTSWRWPRTSSATETSARHFNSFKSTPLLPVSEAIRNPHFIFLGVVRTNTEPTTAPSEENLDPAPRLGTPQRRLLRRRRGLTETGASVRTGRGRGQGRRPAHAGGRG